jgi:uncharacterized tellurite resistance protein B-like protein
MLRNLKDLFEALKPPPEATSPADEDHALQLATAVMLVEVMRSDPETDDRERQATVAALREKFSLEEDEVGRLLELAERTAEDANDYHRFTSRINRGFSREQKIRIIEFMWRIAHADGAVSAHENHLMRKVAALLYISHGDYVGARMRAKAHAGLD